MATRGKSRPDPAELIEHEVSTLLPRTDCTAHASPAVSFSVSSRLRLIAVVIGVLVAVRVVLLGQKQDNPDDRQAEDRFQFDGGNVSDNYQILEVTLERYEDEEDAATPSPETETHVPTEAPSLFPPALFVSETVPITETMTLKDVCYYERDFGLIENASTPAHVFCANAGLGNARSAENRTKVTLVDAPSRLHAVVFEDLLLDMTDAKPYKDIETLAQDGGDHDPRFTFTEEMIYCGCDQLKEYTDSYRLANYELYSVWGPALAFVSRWDQRDASLVCAGANVARPSSPLNDTGTNHTLIEYPGRVLLIARRDDHNPFFQVSNALNAWIMMRALKWDPHNVTLIHFDAGYASPIDALHEKLLAPGTKLQRGRELMGKRLLFSGEVMLAPFETTGPMMQHLDDWEPCFASELFSQFREEALKVMEVADSSQPTVSETDNAKDIVVTFISRKPYQGRVVQRRWINEDEVVSRLRGEYKTFEGRSIVFRSTDFVDLTLQKQMQLMVESDMVVSMHGAGLVNVMWTRPGTLVLEIFPKERRRWGYRNLCQFVGCEWHEFRGGQDIPTGMARDPNANDKQIPYEEWRAFFDPLFQQMLFKISPKRLIDRETDPVASTQPDKWRPLEKETHNTGLSKQSSLGERAQARLPKQN